MSHLSNALTAAKLALSPLAVLSAHERNRPAGEYLYQDSPRRREMRALLDGAAIAGATVTLAFVKVGGDLRYMTCRPCEDADGTCRYYIVQDLEKSSEAGRVVYRRVQLDTIVGATVEYRL